MANRLNILSGFVDPGVNPKLSIGSANTRDLIAFNIQLEQIIDTDQSRAESWRKDKVSVPGMRALT